MFYRIFGTNAMERTKYVFDRLSECMKQKKKAFFVVPEQIALRAEKAIINRFGATSNLYIEVINFKRLCNRVFRELGGLTSTHLDDGAKKILMMQSLEKIAPYLKQYGGSCDSAEFAARSLDMTNELVTYKITPAMLEKAADTLRQDNSLSSTAEKLYDIALIYEAYTSRLKQVPGAVCDIYEKLCTKLEESPFFEGCDVFFDSFYGFTAREYEIIELISEQADNTYVTFSCAKDEKDEIFERCIKSAKKCEKIAEKCGCELCDIQLENDTYHKENSSLSLIEKNFSCKCLTEKNDIFKADDSVKVFVCRDIFEEANFAVSTVLRLVREGNSFSDIMICAKNVEDYMGVLDTAFEKADVPLGVDIPETLAESALFELVCSALEAAKNFKNSSVQRYIKTGLSGLSEQQEDVFEIYIKTWDISPKLMKSDEDWTMNPMGYSDSEPDFETLRIVNEARQKVNICLTSLSQNLNSCKTVKDYALAVYNLLEDIKRINEKEAFDDGNGGVSLALLYECLDSFVSVAGDENISYSRFVTLFKSCGKDYDTGHIPALSNQVQFSSVNLARSSGMKYVILLGVNSGVFPSSCKSKSLISDNEKKTLRTLGLEMSETGQELVYDELFLAYQVITGAKNTAFVSYSAYDNNSNALFPSVIVTAVRHCTSCNAEVFDSRNITEFFPGNELLFEQLYLMDEGEKKNTVKKYFEGLENYRERIEKINEISEQNDTISRQITEKLYSDNVFTTYSRLEKMAGCPFSHFCTYVLSLKPEPTAELGPSEAGNIMHRILEEMVPFLCKSDDDGKYPDETDAKQIVDELLCRHLSRIAHTDMTNIPKRFVYLYNRLSKILHEVAVNIVRELAVSKFRPVDFELAISPGSDVSPVPINLSDGRKLYIVGQIDRVDLYKKDDVSYIRIVDYKTGKKTFKLKDIENGFNLQMLLYLSAVAKGGKERYGENIVPAGVLYSNVISSNISAVYGKDDIDEMSNYIEKPKSSGIFIDDEELLYAMDPTENSLYLPIRRKNGEVKNKDAVASLEELGALLEDAQNTAKELCERMIGGEKSIMPFDGKEAGLDIDPCRYCDMFFVCMGKRKEQSYEQVDT